MKRVRFKPYASLITVPHPDPVPMEEDNDDDDDDDDDESTPTSPTSSSCCRSWGLWYSKEEMSTLARADVSAVVAAHQNGTTMDSSTCTATTVGAVIDNNGDDSSIMDYDESHNTEPPICGRGLEMYLPGQLVLLRRRRKAYQDAALRKQQSLLALCGSKGSEEIATRLEQFLKIRSQESVEKAHGLGLQDAADAHAIHHEAYVSLVDDSSDGCLDSTAPTFIGNKRKALFPSSDEHTATPSSKSALRSPSSSSSSSSSPSSTLMTKQTAFSPNALLSHHAIQRAA